MPGSDITFLKRAKASNLLKYVAVVLLNLAASSDGHEKNSKTHRCLLYALCFYSSWVCGQFMGLSEVPSEQKPDLKPAPGHEEFLFRASYHPSWTSYLGADLRPAQCRAHDNGEVLRVGRSGGQRVNSSECTPGLDRPLCNYHSISLTYI